MVYEQDLDSFAGEEETEEGEEGEEKTEETADDTGDEKVDDSEE